MIFAEFRGSDMWENLAPGSSGLSDRHPLSYYALDYHVDGVNVGITGVGFDAPAVVSQWVASQFFAALIFLMRLVISAFDWAFSADLINGRSGALVPVGAASQHLYSSTVTPLLTTAALVFGAWMASKVLARKFGDAGVGFVRAVCLSAAALVIIFNPAATIGRAVELTNDASSAIVSGTTGAHGSAAVSDRLFDTFIYKPWAVLEFGGLKRCTSTATDADGFPLPVAPDSPDRRTCRDVLRKDANGYGGYAPHFLAYAPMSDERDAEYEALKDGEAPTDGQFSGRSIDKSDAVAVDMMQAGGAAQRLTFVFILGIGILAAILLLGLLCFAALFAQLGILVLVAAAPAIVLVAIFPGAHGIFWGWARLLGKLLIAKVVFSLILSAALGVSAAIMSVGSTTGYLYAFSFQAVLFLGLFIKRKALAEQITQRRDYNKSESKVKAFVGGASTAAVAAVATPATAAAGSVAARLTKEQKPAPKPDDKQPVTAGAKPDSVSPPASAGRDYSPPGKPADSPSTTVATMPAERQAQPTQEGREEMPTRSFREDLEAARQEKAEPRKPVPAPVVPTRANGAIAAGSFATHLEQARKQKAADSPAT